MFKKRKRQQPDQAATRPPPPAEYGPLVEMARHHIESLQTAHSGTWRMDEAARFEVDLDAREITWHFDDPKVVRAPAQLIGTWNPTDETFLWGWDHPSAPPGSAVAAAAVRAHAEAAGIDELLTPTIGCGFDECYPIAGAAVLVGDLQGIYRFDAGGPWVYVGFGNVTISAR